MNRDYAMTGTNREEMIFHKDKLLERGGIHHDQIKKWEKKAREAKAQDTFPIALPGKGEEK